MNSATLHGFESDARANRRLEGWVREYGDALEGHLAAMLNAADARDVLQEVWVTALRSPPDDGPGSNVRGWLFTVATRRALDVLAGSKRRRRLLEGGAGRVAPDGARSPDAFMDRLDEAARQRVRTGVAGLPRKQRDAVWLRWVEGLEYSEVARRIDSSPEAARANVYQGLKRLRRELGDLMEDWT